MNDREILVLAAEIAQAHPDTTDMGRLCTRIRADDEEDEDEDEDEALEVD